MAATKEKSLPHRVIKLVMRIHKKELKLPPRETITNLPKLACYLQRYQQFRWHSKSLEIATNAIAPITISLSILTMAPTVFIGAKKPRLITYLAFQGLVSLAFSTGASLTLGYCTSKRLLEIDKEGKELEPRVISGLRKIPVEELRARLDYRDWGNPLDKRLEIGNVGIPRDLENKGFMLLGAPGTGKTQVICSLLERMKQREDFRAIILDRNGELLERFYDPEKDLIFNPSDIRSLKWNHRCETPFVRMETLAEALIPIEGSNPFWSQSSRNLFADLCDRLASNEELWEAISTAPLKSSNPEVATLEQVLRLPTLDWGHRVGLSSRMLAAEEMVSGILTGLGNHTRFLASLPDPDMDTEPFSFFQWGKNDDPRWIFFPIFEADAQYYRSLYSCLFEMIMRGCLSNEGHQIKTAIVIDELAALQKLESLNRAASEGRKFSMTLMLGLQTISQLKRNYGEEDTAILTQGTATKLILNSRDAGTAEAMSKLIGEQEIEQITQSWGVKGDDVTERKLTGLSQHITKRPVVSPAELQSLPNLQGYLFIADGENPAKVEITPKQYPKVAERFILNPRMLAGSAPAAIGIESVLDEDKKIEQKKS